MAVPTQCWRCVQRTKVWNGWRWKNV